MSKKLLLIGLIFSSLAVQSCKSEASKAVETQITVEVAKPLKPVQEKIILKHSDGKVEFKGVSFDYNPLIFGEVEMEQVAEQPLGGEDHKPYENFPNHLEFYFEKDNDAESGGRIAVVPIEDYRRMYAVSSKLTDAFDKNLNNLQRILMDKNFRVKGEYL